jgi:hypothetical protein
VERRLLDLLQGAHPVLAIVIGALLMILGVLVVLYPPLLAWSVGIGLFLAGVALLAFVFTSADRDRF